MAGRRRCEQTATKKTSRRGDAASSAIAEDSDCTTPVCQATSKPDLELARLRQEEERRVSPTAGRRMTESSPTASHYFLRNTRARACRWVTQVGFDVRLATSPTKARATRRRSGHDVSCGDMRRDGNSGSGPNSARVRKAQTAALHIVCPSFCLLEELYFKPLTQPVGSLPLQLEPRGYNHQLVVAVQVSSSMYAGVQH